MKSGERCRRRIYQEAEAMTEVSKDAMSGFNNGQAIDRISNRFTKFLSSGRKGGNYPYAVSLALDTIDFFRNITRLQFKCSDNHKRNSANGKYPAPAWNGLPHGCALKQDGLVVASSCVYTRRFCLALYYCELLLQGQFEQSYSTAYQYSFDEGLDLLLRYLTVESAVDDGNNDDSTVCSS